MIELWIVTTTSDKVGSNIYRLWNKTELWPPREDLSFCARQYEWPKMERRIIVVHERGHMGEIAAYLTERTTQVKAKATDFPEKLLIAAHTGGTFKEFSEITDRENVFLVSLSHEEDAPTYKAIEAFLSSVEENFTQPSEKAWENLYAEVTSAKNVAREIGDLRHELNKILGYLPNFLISLPDDLPTIKAYAEVYQEDSLNDARVLLYTGGVYTLEDTNGEEKGHEIASDKTLESLIKFAVEQAQRRANLLDKSKANNMRHWAACCELHLERIQELLPLNDEYQADEQFNALFGAGGYLPKLGEAATLTEVKALGNPAEVWARELSSEILSVYYKVKEMEEANGLE